MATHSSILAWEIRWTEVPSRLQSMGSQKYEALQHHLELTAKKMLVLALLSEGKTRQGRVKSQPSASASE